MRSARTRQIWRLGAGRLRVRCRYMDIYVIPALLHRGLPNNDMVCLGVHHPLFAVFQFQSDLSPRVAVTSCHNIPCCWGILNRLLVSHVFLGELPDYHEAGRPGRMNELPSCQPLLVWCERKCAPHGLLRGGAKQGEPTCIFLTKGADHTSACFPLVC